MILYARQADGSLVELLASSTGALEIAGGSGGGSTDPTTDSITVSAGNNDTLDVSAKVAPFTVMLHVDSGAIGQLEVTLDDTKWDTLLEDVTETVTFTVPSGVATLRLTVTGTGDIYLGAR